MRRNPTRPSEGRFFMDPDYTEIIQEAGEQIDPGKVAVALWSGCSFLAHGDISGALIFLAREAISQDEDIMLARITGTFAVLRHCTAVGLAFLGRSSALYRSRAGAPGAGPDRRAGAGPSWRVPWGDGVASLRSTTRPLRRHGSSLGRG